MAKRVCVDLDGVLASYDVWRGPDHIGEPVAGSREFLTRLRSFATVAIWTTRFFDATGAPSPEGQERVRAWLHGHQLPYDEFNLVGKAIASAWVDDRAVECRPERDGSRGFDRALSMCYALVNGTPLGATSADPPEPSAAYPGDEGELQILIRSDATDVRIDFGKAVGYLGMTKPQAREFAKTLLRYADQ